MRSNSKLIYGASGATNGSSVTASFDTQGFGYAKIYCLASETGTLGSGTNNKVEEGDTTSSYATFAGTIQGTDWTASSATNSTSIPKMVYGIDLRGRKRYLKVTFTGAATATPGPIIVCELSEPGDSINSRSSAVAASSVGL